VRVFHCDRFRIALPPGHRFPTTKYTLLRERLLESGLVAAAELCESQPIDIASLRLAHTDEYVDAMIDGTLAPADERRLGFPWSEALILRSRASVYGTVAAARQALADGVAGNLAGGTHHAFADRGAGFCVFNDIAIAIRALQLERRIARAAVIDLDVHQGDGTAAIFEGDDSVFTLSLHGAKNFPFRKQRSRLDVELPDGCGDTEYLDKLEQHLGGALEGAEIAFFQAGVDPLKEDTLGRLDLTLGGLRRRDRLVLEAAKARRLPIVLTLGGGYAKPLELSIEAHAGTYREARAVFG
jgi:acetoin utilization deacetylase AcuC-like enzyme